MVLYFGSSWASYLEWVDMCCSSLGEVLSHDLRWLWGWDTALVMFSVSLNKNLTKSNVRVKRFILACIMGWCDRSWWDKGNDFLCGRMWATHFSLESRQQGRLDFSHFYSVCISSPWDGVTLFLVALLAPGKPICKHIHTLALKYALAIQLEL